MMIFWYNETDFHWFCMAIFMDLRIIQAFDSLGGGREEELKDLYRGYTR